MTLEQVAWCEETARVARDREGRMQDLVRNETTLRDWHAERAGAARGLAFRVLEQVYDLRGGRR